MFRVGRMRARLAPAALVLALVVAGGGAALYRYRSHAFDPTPYLRPQRLVDIGGRRLNLWCSGSGSPTVLLDAGLGGSTLSWRYVQPPLSARTTVCSYDRAGMGFSDPGPLPRSSAAAADDIRLLVERAPLRRPLVLVGHSLGAMNVRLFAYRSPHDVAALVLVDPADEDERSTDRAISPAFWDSQVAKPMQRLIACRARAERAVHDGSVTVGDCAPARPRFGRALNDERARQARNPALWETQISELRSYDSVSEGELRSARRSLGSIPIVVLTHGIPQDAPGVAAQTSRRIESAFLRLHEREAADSRRGVSRVVPGSGHDIELDRPRAVIDAVREALDMLQSSSF